jgi:hypothetical protein
VGRDVGFNSSFDCSVTTVLANFPFSPDVLADEPPIDITATVANVFRASKQARLQALSIAQEAVRTKSGFNQAASDRLDLLPRSRVSFVCLVEGIYSCFRTC